MSDGAARILETLRRAAPDLAWRANRRATLAIHGLADSRHAIPAALRASTRKVAWKTSSTSCSFRKIRRQIRSTRRAKSSQVS